MLDNIHARYTTGSIGSEVCHREVTRKRSTV